MKLARIHSTNPDINRLQSEVSAVLDHIQMSPLVGPNSLIESIKIDGPTTVAHKLGRMPEGYIITLKNAPGDVYCTDLNAQTATFNSSVPVTVSLLFF